MTTATPRLQIALDTFTLDDAYRALQPAAASVDIIEVGTILCLSEGMRAVREIHALFPEKDLLADVRIAEAGSIISRLAFDSGANLVSVVAGASLTTVGQVCKVAEEYGAEVQIELDEANRTDAAVHWRAAGVKHVIVHRSRDAEAAGSLRWKRSDIDSIRLLDQLGFTVTITGGITASELPELSTEPVGIVIAGRSIVQAADPAKAAADFRTALGAVWP